MTKTEWEKIITRATQIMRVDADTGQPANTQDTVRQLSFEFSIGNDDGWRAFDTAWKRLNRQRHASQSEVTP